jgi:hypothetical protein
VEVFFIYKLNRKNNVLENIRTSKMTNLIKGQKCKFVEIGLKTIILQFGTTKLAQIQIRNNLLNDIYSPHLRTIQVLKH